VLSVGDEAFQDRCLEAIRRFHQAGKTLILVSHDVASVCNICTDCLWISEGQIRAHGSPRIVVADYQAAAHQGGTSNLAAEVGNPDLAALMPSATSGVPDRWGSGEAEIVAVEFVDARGQAGATYRSGDFLSIRVHYRAHERIGRPVFGLGINTVDNVHVTGPNTKADDLTIASIAGEGCVTYDIRDLPLQPGEYRVSVSIYDESCTHAYDYHDRRYAFRVLPSGPGPQYGVMRLPAAWRHEAHGGVEHEEIGIAGLRGSGL
jgi:hypothetical protein